MDAEEIRYKYMPNGAINLKLVGGGNGKPQYEYEKKIMRQMLDEYAALRISAVIKSLPDSDEIRMKARELDEKDFVQWMYEILKGNVL